MPDGHFVRVIKRKEVLALAFGAMIGWSWVALDRKLDRFCWQRRCDPGFCNRWDSGRPGWPYLRGTRLGNAAGWRRTCLFVSCPGQNGILHLHLGNPARLCIGRCIRGSRLANGGRLPGAGIQSWLSLDRRRVGRAFHLGAVGCCSGNRHDGYQYPGHPHRRTATASGHCAGRYRWHPAHYRICVFGFCTKHAATVRSRFKRGSWECW